MAVGLLFSIREISKHTPVGAYTTLLQTADVRKFALVSIPV